MTIASNPSSILDPNFSGGNLFGSANAQAGLNPGLFAGIMAQFSASPELTSEGVLPSKHAAQIIENLQLNSPEGGLMSIAKLKAAFLNSELAIENPEQYTKLISDLSGGFTLEDVQSLVTQFNDPKLAEKLHSLSTNGEDLSAEELFTFLVPDMQQAALDQDINFFDAIATTFGFENPLFAAEGSGKISIEDMSVEEFTQLKRMAFADIAAFFSIPRRSVNENGVVTETLQGPSFLNQGQQNSFENFLIGLSGSQKGTSTLLNDDILAAMNGLAPLKPGIMNAFVQMTNSQAEASANIAAQAATAANESNAFAKAIIGDALASAEKGLTDKPQFVGMQLVKTDQAELRPLAQSGAVIITTPAIQNANSNSMVANLQTSGTSSQSISTTTPVNNEAQAQPFQLYSDDFFEGSFGDENRYGALRPTSSGLNPLSVATQAHTMLGQTTQAGQPHPASHMVSVALQKHAMPQNGSQQTATSERALTIFLDPPEMGRVDIMMKFATDNSVKAHLIVEKPETLQLLQKDSSQLAKVFSDMGLEASEDSLSFDLGQGQNDGGQTAEGQAKFGTKSVGFSPETGEIVEDVETIETEMTTFVDPITGQQRVNMIV